VEGASDTWESKGHGLKGTRCRGAPQNGGRLAETFRISECYTNEMASCVKGKQAGEVVTRGKANFLKADFSSKCRGGHEPRAL